MTVQLKNLLRLFVIAFVCCSLAALQYPAEKNKKIKGMPRTKVEVPSINPIDEDLWVRTSAFGSRNGRMHKGLDIICNAQTPIHATADGEVVMIKTKSSGYGKLVIIKHNDTYQTYYAHLSSYKCKLGDQVKQGDVIGLVGRTGNATTNHLHYEVRVNGKAVNPIKYIPGN